MPLFPLDQGTPLARQSTYVNPTVSSTYDVCFRAQDYIDQNPARFPDERKRMETLIHIRLLGYMLTHFYDSYEVTAAVVRSITSSQHIPSPSADNVEGDNINITALSELGQFYKDFLLRPFRKIKSRTPVTSTHPSRPSPELTQEEVKAILADAPKDYSKSRKLAMRREGHRCVVTRLIDTEYYVAHRHGFFSAPCDTATLELCHIFSELTNAGLHNGDKHKYATNAWSVLRSFGYTQIVNDLATAEKVHSLENVMIMDSGLHDCFDTLRLWFEPVQGTPHRYRVIHVVPLNRYNLPDEVQFTSEDPQLPLPNPEYLRIHAACCRLSWLSGASGLFDELQEDMEVDPDATTEIPAFARSLHARLEHTSYLRPVPILTTVPADP